MNFSPSFLRLVRGADGNLFRHMNAISLQHYFSVRSPNCGNEIGEQLRRLRLIPVSCAGAQPERRSNEVDLLSTRDVIKPVPLMTFQSASACLRSLAASAFLVELFSQYGKLAPLNEDPNTGPDCPSL